VVISQAGTMLYYQLLCTPVKYMVKIAQFEFIQLKVCIFWGQKCFELIKYYYIP